MIWCICDTKYGVVIEIGRRETMYSVVNDAYKGDFNRYKVYPWRG